MSYIILNGVKSTDIRGLLIQSLPPISKPLIRTQIEEIDGRDGDIVTKLGYAAYDKEMQIGLHGDYDVDEVIKYFDSQGTVTFSNESDKYYYYQIIEQIDFERLIRFRTAKVVFHVQPFKYSTVDQKFTLNNQFISFDDYTETKNGITLSAVGGVISVSGTGSTEFYMPIDKADLEAGIYTLRAFVQGTGGDACSLRLIDDVPANADSFGETDLILDDDVCNLAASLEAEKSFDYLYFSITSGTAMNFNLVVKVTNDGVADYTLTNRGNTFSRPKITIHGSGTINLSLNGNQIFVINLNEDDWITIDSAQMNAYQDGILRNRIVTGDYDNFVLPVGKNIISWTGIVTEFQIENFSRWI